ncbi:hypothetical protein D3C72_1757680 [compost metagenome]
MPRDRNIRGLALDRDTRKLTAKRGLKCRLLDRDRRSLLQVGAKLGLALLQFRPGRCRHIDIEGRAFDAHPGLRYAVAVEPAGIEGCEPAGAPALDRGAVGQGLIAGEFDRACISRRDERRDTGDIDIGRRCLGIARHGDEKDGGKHHCQRSDQHLTLHSLGPAPSPDRNSSREIERSRDLDRVLGRP